MSSFARPLFAARRKVSFDANALMLREGEVPQLTYTVFSGWAHRSKHLSDGRRQILSFLLPGDLVLAKAFAVAPIKFSVRTITPVSACAFEREEMFRFLGGSLDLLRSCGNIYFTELDQGDQRILDLGRRNAMGRVASLLLEIHQRLVRKGLAADGPFEFPLRQEHFADALGLTTAHVNRTFGAMKSKGLVKYGPGWMEICDRVALERLLG